MSFKLPLLALLIAFITTPGAMIFTPALTPAFADDAEVLTVSDDKDDDEDDNEEDDDDDAGDDDGQRET